MNNHSSLAFALYPSKFDPLMVIKHTRMAMLTPEPETTTYGMQGYAWQRRRDAYRAAVDRLGKRAYLPDRTPRTALEAGLMVLERAQVMGARA